MELLESRCKYKNRRRSNSYVSFDIQIYKIAFHELNIKNFSDLCCSFVNQIVADEIKFHNADPSEWGPLHFIGHSLGAHICGYAAHELKLRGSEWPVARITGLDPAQPCFRNSDPTLRLDKSDAHFVDVIHTNGHVLKKLGLGLPYPLGTHRVLLFRNI